MKIIWTKGNSILSKAICWGLDEPVSHVAIVFDDKIVFHSNLLGVHLNWLDTFKKHSEIIYTIDYPMSLEKEEAVYQRLIKHDERPYDYSSFFYFGLCILKKKFLGIPIPEKNPVDNPNADLCYELCNALNGLLFNKDIEGKLISPYTLYKWLS